MEDKFTILFQGFTFSKETECFVGKSW